MGAELGWDTLYSLIPLLKLNGADGKTVTMATSLVETLDFMKDTLYLPSTAALSHDGSRPVSIPTPQIIKVGDGWDPSVATWVAFKDVLSLFKDRIKAGLDELALAGDKLGKLRIIEAAHLEGFSQGVCNHIFNGTSASAPEKFLTLNERYKTPDATDPWNPASAGQYGVIDMGGTGVDTTSVWLIQHGKTKFHGIIPKNDPQAGIKKTDMGVHYFLAENSKQKPYMIEEVAWTVGICVEDVKSIVRVRNIESAIASIASNRTLWQKLLEAREMFNGPETVWMYTNRRIRAQLKIMVADKVNVQYSVENPYKIPLLTFDDMPIRRLDAISNSETAVAAA